MEMFGPPFLLAVAAVPISMDSPISRIRATAAQAFLVTHLKKKKKKKKKNDLTQMSNPKNALLL
jgi:hypothetical protein